MVRIYEEHYEVTDRKNKQERIIESYNDFDEYLEYLLKDKSKELYPSLPRQIQILNWTTSEDWIRVEFINLVNGLGYIHIGQLIK
ncbi:hypothetical protein [Paenibacillus sp. EKM207P]|uniref:hypothetical protein n=1 Tax=Paenibacillus sp. EKM207P TaxID=1683675 RepID=UPI001EEB1672|nr:hypothetical protein [Paenibacillus sp. EKM207P]